MILTRLRTYSIIEVVHIDSSKLRDDEVEIFQIMSLGNDDVAIEYEYK